MVTSEHEGHFDEYVEQDRNEIRGAILEERLRHLEPAAPVLCRGDDTVHEAIERIKKDSEHQGAVLIVDASGALVGIFSERDMMNRVLGEERDPKTTRLEEVMTRAPFALSAGDTIAQALHTMAVRGIRNIPIVKDGKPIGIVFTQHFVKFIVSLYPQKTLNLSEREIRNTETVAGG